MPLVLLCNDVEINCTIFSGRKQAWRHISCSVVHCCTFFHEPWLSGMITLPPVYCFAVSQTQPCAITYYTCPLGWGMHVYVYKYKYISLTSALDFFFRCPCRLRSLRSRRVANQEEEAVPLQSGHPGVTPAHPPGGLDPCSHPSHLFLPTPQTS